MKRLTIRVFGSKRPLIHIQIQPGTKISHVLAYLKLYNSFLIPASAEASTEDFITEIFKDFKNGHGSVDLYERVADGDKLIAVPAIEAARLAYADMVRNSPLKETIK